MEQGNFHYRFELTSPRWNHYLIYLSPRKDRMKAVPIGKGLYRITVRSRAKRARLALLPEVLIEGERVFFPAWLYGSIRRLIDPKPKREWEPIPEQTKLFPD